MSDIPSPPAHRMLQSLPSHGLHEHTVPHKLTYSRVYEQIDGRIDGELRAPTVDAHVLRVIFMYSGVCVYAVTRVHCSSPVINPAWGLVGRARTNYPLLARPYRASLEDSRVRSRCELLERVLVSSSKLWRFVYFLFWKTGGRIIETNFDRWVPRFCVARFRAVNYRAKVAVVLFDELSNFSGTIDH